MFLFRVVQKRYVMLFFYIFFYRKEWSNYWLILQKYLFYNFVHVYKIKIVEIKIIEKVNGREINSLSNKL